MEENIDYSAAINKTRELRRIYSRMLYQLCETNTNELIIEDVVRIIGHLQTSYDHLLAAKAQDGSLYCVLCKHLPAVLILAGEIGEEVGPIYDIMSDLNPNFKPCLACNKQEEE